MEHIIGSLYKLVEEWYPEQLVLSPEYYIRIDKIATMMIKWNGLLKRSNMHMYPYLFAKNNLNILGLMQNWFQNMSENLRGRFMTAIKSSSPNTTSIWIRFITCAMFPTLTMTLTMQ